MSPTDALYEMVATHLCVDRRRDEKPGYFISHAGPEVREALARLTSDDALKIRYVNKYYLDRSTR
jgi:hypothetical protein